MSAAAGFALALALPAVSGELPLQLPTVGADGTYFTLRVPLDVRAQATSPTLDDLRVLNAAGQPVPHAWVDAFDAPPAAPRQQAVPLFKAPAPPAPASAAAPAATDQWVVDLRAVRAVPQALQLGVTPGSNGIFGFVLEASADLQQWRTVLPEARLVALQHQGLRLDHSHFELGSAALSGGYLRVRPLPGQPLPPLATARVTSLADVAQLPDWQWSGELAPSRCEPTHCDYVLPRHLPLQRVEFKLAEPNTLARVELLAQWDDAPTPPAANSRLRHHHPVREHLRALRHKGAASSPQRHEPPFVPVGSGTVYALNLQGGLLQSAALDLGGGLYRTLRVQPTGGMAQLGQQPPTLRVAGRAESLVFLARGAAPYRLAWAQASAPAVLPLDQLMPGRQPGDALPASATVAPVPAPVVAAPPSVAASTPAPPDTGHRKWWLWAALVAALALMGAMAWSLLKKPAD